MNEREHSQHHHAAAPPAEPQATSGAKYTCPCHPQILRDAPGELPDLAAWRWCRSPEPG